MEWNYFLTLPPTPYLRYICLIMTTRSAANTKSAFTRYVGQIILTFIFLLSVGGGSIRAIETDPIHKSIYFKATGHIIEGKFLQYWQSHGGLALFGYPLTPAFYEGGYLVQYFERNRFELHTENAGTPYDVLLGQLGRERIAECGMRNADCRLILPTFRIPHSAFRIPQFLDYWGKHGGLAQFGYPITPEFMDEKGVIVQYFERARFELHPEFKGTDYYVLLGLLGRDSAQKLDPALLDRWSEGPQTNNLRLEGAGKQAQPLTPLAVTSDLPGEIRLLGGDNHQYATYSVQAHVPLTIYAAGAPGPQSIMLYQNGQVAGAIWSAFTMSAPQPGIKTGDPLWDGLYPRLKSFLEKDAVVYYSPLDDKPVRGYRSPDTQFIWLRDHVYQSSGFKYFEPDMKGALDYFRSTQHPDGSFDDYFLHYPGADVYKDQIEIEADREFLFVEGVWIAWQSTGDDAWLRLNLPAMERGLEYTFTDPHRWSKEMGLVMRAFTIDTWDFEQGSEGANIRRKFDDKTRWSIMHGDNTGAYRSARLLAHIERYFGQTREAQMWDALADSLLANLNRVSWNGQFYTHQVHLIPVEPTGVDEATQLSLSNAYALNRGTLSQEQAAALIKTYQARKQHNGPSIFAEWYSIDPPFPAGFGKSGEYVNGGVMPLVGGELARGTFTYGFEAYGVDILRRYWQLLDRTGGSYLWYYPDGRPGVKPEGGTLSTDGWGSAAMLDSLTEGLAGVVDNGKLYESVSLSPRWAVTDRHDAQVTLGYGASGAYFTYNWQFHEDKTMSLTWGGGQTRSVQLHLLLPAEMPTPRQAVLNEITSLPISVVKVEQSYYLDVTLPGSGHLDIR